MAEQKSRGPNLGLKDLLAEAREATTEDPEQARAIQQSLAQTAVSAIPAPMRPPLALVPPPAEASEAAAPAQVDADTGAESGQAEEETDPSDDELDGITPAAPEAPMSTEIAAPRPVPSRAKGGQGRARGKKAEVDDEEQGDQLELRVGMPVAAPAAPRISATYATKNGPTRRKQSFYLEVGLSETFTVVCAKLNVKMSAAVEEAVVDWIAKKRTSLNGRKST